MDQLLAKTNMAKKNEKRLLKQIWKRKEALETMLFKMKYDKLLKTLAGGNYMISQMRKEKGPSSIYIENPQDPKVDIPSNIFMFNNIIKDTFEVEDSSTDEEDERQFMTGKEWLDICLDSYEEKNPFKVGKVYGPSQRKINKLDCVD